MRDGPQTPRRYLTRRSVISVPLSRPVISPPLTFRRGVSSVSLSKRRRMVLPSTAPSIGPSTVPAPGERRTARSGGLDDLVGVEARLRAANKRVTVVTGGHRRAGLLRVGGGGHRGTVAGRLARADRARRADGARAHSKRGDRREHERDPLEHPHRLPPPFRCVLLTSFEVSRRQRVTASGASARASHDRDVLVALSCNHDPNANSPWKVSIFRTTVHNASCTTFSASCPSPGTASTFISLPRVVGEMSYS